MILLSILVFIIIFSILVIVHESGHFMAARISNVKVEEFGLGMGKKIWGKKKGETEFTFNAVPFGGFVRLLGEEEESHDPRSFSKATLWKRIMITLAGVFMNMVLAVLLLTILFSVGTEPIIITKTEFDTAIKNGVIKVSEPDKDGNQIILDIQKVQKNFPQSFFFAITETARISKAIVIKAGEIPMDILQNHKIPKGISGPLGIAEVTNKVVPQGILPILKLLAMLSLSLGVMNLLPIPALDGGRFLFQIVELITFHKPRAKWENAIHGVGFFILMALMVAVTWNDIVRMFFS